MCNRIKVSTLFLVPKKGGKRLTEEICLLCLVLHNRFVYVRDDNGKGVSGGIG